MFLKYHGHRSGRSSWWTWRSAWQRVTVEQSPEGPLGTQVTTPQKMVALPQLNMLEKFGKRPFWIRFKSSNSPFWGLKYIKIANMICKNHDLKETIWVLKYGIKWWVKWPSSIIDHRRGSWAAASCWGQHGWGLGSVWFREFLFCQNFADQEDNQH